MYGRLSTVDNVEDDAILPWRRQRCDDDQGKKSVDGDDKGNDHSDKGGTQRRRQWWNSFDVALGDGDANGDDTRRQPATTKTIPR